MSLRADSARIEKNRKKKLTQQTPLAEVAVVSAWVGPKPDELGAVMTNHREYCHRHEYSYIHFDQEKISAVLNLVGNDADAHWIKPEVIRSALENYKYVFWTDLDSVFHQQRKSLSDLINLEKDFVFTGDHNDLCNGGHLLFQRSPWTANFLDQWTALRHIKFPPLHTSMQSPEGYVGDQIALNYLLGGGESSVSSVKSSAKTIINTTNGWEGNPDRIHSDFAQKYSPTRKTNLSRTKQLISDRLLDYVGVVVQHRINAYPWWGAKKKKNRRGPIIHFVSPHKDQLTDYLKENGYLNTREVGLA